MNCVRVGYGCVAPIHEQKLQLFGVKTIGVVEIDPTKIEDVKKKGFTFCQSLEKAAELKPTFWDICTPPQNHLDTIKAIIALDPKACILVEKPVCLEEQIFELEQVVSYFDGKLVVNENYFSSTIAEKVKDTAFNTLHLRPTTVVVEMDKNRTQDFQKGRYVDPVGAFGYEGPHMITILQNLGEKFLPQGGISNQFEDIEIPERLPNQGLADITYSVNGVSVNLFSSMNGKLKHRYPPYAVESIPVEDTATRYRIAAIEGLDEKNEKVTVVGFYEPLNGLPRCQGALAIIRNGVVDTIERSIEDDSMGKHLGRAVEYFKGTGESPCTVKQAIATINVLSRMWPNKKENSLQFGNNNLITRSG